MSSADALKKRLEKSIGQMIEQARQYSQMPLETRLDELRRLHQRIRGLERGVSVINMRIMILEQMPDVAEERIRGDKIAMSLLQNLSKKRDIAYRNFVEGENEDIKTVVTHYLYMLRTAKLVELEDDPAYPTDNIIKLTERGRALALQYAEQK